MEIILRKIIVTFGTTIQVNDTSVYFRAIPAYNLSPPTSELFNPKNKFLIQIFSEKRQNKIINGDGAQSDQARRALRNVPCGGNKNTQNQHDKREEITKNYRFPSQFLAQKYRYFVADLMRLMRIFFDSEQFVFIVRQIAERLGGATLTRGPAFDADPVRLLRNFSDNSFVTYFRSFFSHIF